MAYQPTGRPPGRPRKDGSVPARKAKPAADDGHLVTHPAETPGFPPASGQEDAERKFDGSRGAELGALCARCWPDGWPGKATGLGCAHGSWTRRLT